jgi:hypothetical protein
LRQRDAADANARRKIFVVALLATLTLSAISRKNPTFTGLAIAMVVAALLSFAGLNGGLRPQDHNR